MDTYSVVIAGSLVSLEQVTEPLDMIMDVVQGIYVIEM
jgi:hypothetical protein